MTPLILKYSYAADNTKSGWDSNSLPLGNGYMGVSLFGDVTKDRLAITENSFANPPSLGGLTYPVDLYFEYDHDGYTDYKRILDIENSHAYVTYTCNGVEYTREYFTSYPDKVLVMRLTASEKGAVSFKACPEVPFIAPYMSKKGDGGGRHGKVTAEGNTVTVTAKLNYYNVRFEGQIRIMPEGGKMTVSGNSIKVKDADSVLVIFGCGTNYVLSADVFTEQDPKKKIPNVNPHKKVQKILDDACKKSYDELVAAHEKDYSSLFGRVELDLAEGYDNRDTDQLLKAYKEGEKNLYLEQLLFQYGRYLLICSSRKGCLPAHLQGIWNVLKTSPWGAGYWHNINQQMNYWPAFNTNLIELFEPYIEFNEAFRVEGQKFASEYVKRSNPEAYTDKPGECGWVVSTPCWPYMTVGLGERSGPGTCGFTTQLFWDAYAFSQDKKLLKDHVFPALYTMSKFHTKCVSDFDGEKLCRFSESQEQDAFYSEAKEDYTTVGAPFDQQMIWENGRDMLLAAEILGKDDKLIKTQKEQMPLYHPVEIGWSGQIKEWREENFYGELGEYEHRHMSHLLGLYPGSLINRETPAWLDAAKVSLRERGWKKQGGWALAQRCGAWARTGNAERAYTMLNALLAQRIANNLWNSPLYQIDGNFGATAGMAEMLVQSHEKNIVLLPALPEEWSKSGSFKGLTARGAFVIDAEWKNGTAKTFTVRSVRGNECRLQYPNIAFAHITDAEGKDVAFTAEGKDVAVFKTSENGVYTISGIKARKYAKAPADLNFNRDTMTLTWKCQKGATYNVYRAFDSAPGYELIASGLEVGKLTDATADFDNHEIITYKVNSVNKDGDECDGPTFTVNHATERQVTIYNRYVHHIF